MSFIGMSISRCNYGEDTIAAISTAPGKSAIALVRISGNRAIIIANDIFKGAHALTAAKSHTVQYGHVVDNAGKIIDEVLLSVYLAPRTYTREDVVEIGCHGGSIAARTVLQAVVDHGARMAEPGEFTQRAFLNGRIDLTQAEAITEIIGARTSRALKQMQHNLCGSMKNWIIEVRAALSRIVMYIEAEVDFPDEEIEPLSNNEIMAAIELAIFHVDKAITGFEKGRMLREGMRLTIAGRPNVGKSSLMNALLRSDRAIVTDIPGTTRDTIEENANIKGIPVVLTDTAGLRETTDVIESLGIERTRDAILHSDLVLLVLDSSVPLQHEDEVLLQMTEQTNRIVVFSKIDKKNDAFAVPSLTPDVEVSVLTGENIDKLETVIETFAGGEDDEDNIFAGSLRQQELLLAVSEALIEIRDSFVSGLPVDIISVDLQRTLYLLGEITGENGSDDVINNIFSEFCLGK